MTRSTLFDRWLSSAPSRPAARRVVTGVRTEERTEHLAKVLRVRRQLGIGEDVRRTAVAIGEVGR